MRFPTKKRTRDGFLEKTSSEFVSIKGKSSHDKNFERFEDKI
jgi:hypothetical protein